MSTVPVITPEKPKFNLIGWLTRFWNRPVYFWAGWILFLLTLPFMALSLQMGLVIFVSMLVHELAHAAVLRQMGVSWTIVPIWPFGMAAMPRNADSKSIMDKAPWSQSAIYLIAGPAATTMLMILGSVLKEMPGLTSSIGADVVLANGVLAVFNLVPLGKLDGGQYWFVIMSSLKEQYDAQVARLIDGTAAIVAGLSLVVPLTYSFNAIIANGIRHWIYILLPVIIAWGVRAKSKEDNPEHNHSPQAISVYGTLWLILAYLVLNLLVAVILTT